MHRWLILSIFVGILHYSAYGNEEQSICKKVEKIALEAKLLYKKFNDPENALVLLKHSRFSSILYRKPECMDDKTYIGLINRYAKYLSETTTYIGRRNEFERFIEKYPENAPMYLYLGNIYKKMFSRSDYRKFEYRDKALSLYRRYIALTKRQGLKISKEVRDYVESGGLEKVQRTWGDYLNPSGTAPVNKFRAFYLDMQHPKKVVASEIVETVGVNYPWKEFHNIDAKHFGAYWVGNFVFDQDKKMNVALSLSWAKARLIIDGLLVYEGGNSVEIPYLFKRGKHKVEVEYINNWHTVGFAMHITPFKKRYAFDTLKKIFSSVTEPYERWYVGVYESSDMHHHMKLVVDKSDRAVVLFLQSYETMIWEIDNKKGTKIVAVVVGRSKPGSEVLGDIQNIPIYYTKSRIGGAHQLYPDDCHCTSGIFHCEGSGIKSVNNTIEYLTGKKVSGFSGRYKADLLRVPEVVLNEEKYAEIEKKLEEIEERRKSCLKNNNPNFENIFR